jgi:hypothetical protein
VRLLKIAGQLVNSAAVALSLWMVWQVVRVVLIEYGYPIR